MADANKPKETQQKQPTKDDLRQSLRSRLHAAKITRMSKNARNHSLDKLQKQVQAELGTDYDMNTVMKHMFHSGKLDPENLDK